MRLTLNQTINMKKYLLPLISVLTIGMFSCKDSTIYSSNVAQNMSALSAARTSASAWTTVLNDDFNAGATLNQWIFADRADYNSSKCVYSPSVPVIGALDGNSCLLITATKTLTGYKSGFCKSNFSFKPARNEEYHTFSKIKLIAQSGTIYNGFASTYGAWPAFWTVQENAWPTQGEIDIMEGYSFGTAATTRFASNLFYGTTTGVNLLGTTAEKPITIGEGWHTYEEFWKNQAGTVTVTIVVDGVTTTTYTNAINSNLRLQNFGPHNVILNLNVGSDDINFINPNLINLFDKTQMYVDFVKVEKRTI